MQEGISEGIVEVLILTIPDVLTCRWEPEMNYGLVMNVDIDLKSIREYMMSVVFVTPPTGAKSKEELTEDLIKDVACFASTMAIVMSEPAGLLDS